MPLLPERECAQCTEPLRIHEIKYCSQCELTCCSVSDSPGVKEKLKEAISDIVNWPKK
jgi:hypothetical protein